MTAPQPGPAPEGVRDPSAAPQLKEEFGAGVRWLLATRARRRAAIVAGWTAVGLISSAHWQLFYLGDSPYSWWQLLRIKIVLWYLWGGCTLWILWACRRWRPEGPHWGLRLVALLGWSVVQVGVYLAAYSVAIWAHLRWMGANAQLEPMVRFVLDHHSTFYYLAFWATVGIEYAFEYSRRLRTQELSASELRAQLLEARWHTLQARLQPHFLFNALNTIASMVRDGRAEEAHDVVVRLSELLRESLKKSQLREVPLARELEFSGHYLEIARARFPDRLAYRIECPEELASRPVPALILQPLVENAVVHGLADPEVKLELNIHCKSDHDTLWLCVSDNGSGLPERFETEGRDGFGLENTRARLATLFGDRAQLQLERQVPRGVIARILLPASNVGGTP